MLNEASKITNPEMSSGVENEPPQNQSFEPEPKISWNDYDESINKGTFNLSLGEGSFIRGDLSKNRKIVRGYVDQNIITAHIDMVKVEKKLRGQGISKRLLQLLAKELVKNHVSVMTACPINAISFNSFISTFGKENAEIFDSNLGPISDKSNLSYEEASAKIKQYPDKTPDLYLFINLANIKNIKIV